MAKVLMVIAQAGFRDEELFVPKEIIEKAGHSVKIASLTRTRATGVKGAVVQPDFAVYETNPDFFDCIIIVGGPGSPMLAENKEVTDLLMISHKKEKTIGAICLGPVVLARAGILSDKSSTVFPDRNAIITLRNAGAIYRAQPVVVDGNIVTADGPESAGKFGTEIVGLLKR